MGVIAFIILLFWAGVANAEEEDLAPPAPIKLAYIDSLTGPFGAAGRAGLRGLEFAVATLVNDRKGVLGGRRLAVVAMDNGLSPIRSQWLLREAIADGTRIIISGLGSPVTEALAEAVLAHNLEIEDEAGRVIYFSLGGTSLDLIEPSCHRWFFRFAPTVHMRLAAAMEAERADDKNRAVFFLGYDTLHDRALARIGAELAEKKRDGKQAFSSAHLLAAHSSGLGHAKAGAVTKALEKARTRTIITTAWGSDLAWLGRIFVQKGWDQTKLYALYGLSDPVAPPYDGKWAANIRSVHAGVMNPSRKSWREMVDAYRAGASDNSGYGVPAVTTLDAIKILVRAIKDVGSVDADRLAGKLTEISIASEGGGMMRIRPDDNQALHNLHVSRLVKGKDIKVVLHSSGYGLQSVWSRTSKTGGLGKANCRISRD